MGQPERDDITARLRDVQDYYGKLTSCSPVPVEDAQPPKEPGVYVFIEGHPCYVGRTSNRRQRIQQHRRGNGESGHLPATIARHDGIPPDAAKRRVRAMKVRWVVVAEDDDHGVCQALLELYAAVKLPTLATEENRRYNTFRNH